MEFTSSDSEIVSETEYEPSEEEPSEDELDDNKGDCESDVEIPLISSIDINLNNDESDLAVPTGSTDTGNKENLARENTQKAVKKQRNRRKHHCIYCYQSVSNYSRHLERNHSDELQVQEILCLNKNSEKRKKLIDKLRREGDFVSTDVVPVLKIQNKPTADYIACKFCKGYYSRKSLRRHVKKCFFNPDPSKPIQSQIEGQNIMVGPFGPNDPLKISGILNKLRADKTSLIAKQDKIICEVARRYLKSHREKHLVAVAKRYMRRLARILEQVRQYEGNSKLSLEQILKPSKFKNIIRATKVIAGHEIETQTYKSPSFALQMGTLLKRAVEAALSVEIQRDNPSNEKRTDLNNFMHLIETDWQYEISTQAVQNLAINRFNKPTLIPLTEDIKKFDTYLKNIMITTVEKLNANSKDRPSFKLLMEVVFCSLMIFNKRRVGELQRMTLQAYLKNYENVSSSEFEKALTNSEKIMYKQLKRVVIRGKRGRGVPVLFEKDVVKMLTFLIDLRKNFDLENNTYLFGLPNTSNPISGYNVLRKHAHLALDDKNRASLITSTKLRKHLATITQIFKMNKTDLEQLASFMGHTQKTHSEFYRLPDDIYQTAKVSKLLMLSKHEILGSFKGKSLEEIELNENTDNVIEGQDSDDEMEIDELKESNEIHQMYSSEEEHEKENTDETERSKKVKEKVTGKRKQHVKVPWTSEQKQLTEKFFAKSIKNKIPPKKHEVEKFKEKYPEIFKNKSWPVIKVYVCNKYNKM